MRAILTYHSIDDSGSPISVSPAVLERHLDWLASGPARVVPLSEIADRTDGDSQAIALTFDDALTSFAAHAWPRLRDRGLAATLFVPTGHVGGRNDWPAGPARGIPGLRLLDWSELRRLAAEGVVLGSHGRRHLDLRTLSDAELDTELAASRSALARETGVEADSVAYPYGAVDERVAAAAARHYRLAVTTELRPVAPDDAPCLLPRLDAFYFRRPGTLEAWGTRRFRRRLALRRAARSLRARLRGRPPRGPRRAAADG